MIARHRDFPAHRPGQMDEPAQEALAQFPINGGIVPFDIIPQFGFFLKVFPCSAFGEQHRGNGGDDFQIAEHIIPLMCVGDRIQIHLGHHHFIHQQRLVDAADHHVLMHRLILPADEIVVQVHVHIVHGFDILQRHIDVQFVHVEGVPGQFQAAVQQKPGAVNHRMHQKVMPQAEIFCFRPAKDGVFRQRAGVAHHVLVPGPHFVVNIIADHHVHRRRAAGQGGQFFQHPGKGFLIQPVVRIHHLEIRPRSRPEAGHDRGTVAAVFLVDRPHDLGIALRVFIGNGGRGVPGPVVHDEDLQLIPPRVRDRKQRIHRVGHIVLGIIAGNGNGQKLQWYQLQSRPNAQRSAPLRIRRILCFYPGPGSAGACGNNGGSAAPAPCASAR